MEGSMGGGKGGSSTTTTNPYAATESQISQELYDTTKPLREALLPKYQSAIAGGYDYRSDPAYAPLFAAAKGGIESQYGQARQSILGSTPSGGGLTKALSNLDIARASDLGTVPMNLQNQIAQKLLGEATSTAWGTPQISIGGLGNAGAIYGQQVAQEQAAANQGKAGLGSGIGSLLGMGIGTAFAPGIGTTLGGSAGAIGGKSAFG
jgi:hypothetical protein